MHAITNQSSRLPIQILTISIFIVLALFMWQGDKGFNIGDEGFLWYGVQRVMLGEVPIRDFMAYDPGRYYWSAALMSLWGDNGIMPLRGAVAIFQALGLFVGLLLIANALKKHNILYTLLSAITLVVWMYPRHKLFDISLSILLIGVLAFLIQSPTNRRFVIAGLCVGLVACFGRNHGIYAVFGSLGVMLWLNINRTEGPSLIKGFALWASGVTIGFTPILLMALLLPGFAIAFWEGLSFVLARGSTNLPLPIPWPWLVNFNAVSLGQAIRGVLIGLFFIGTIAIGLLSISWVVWQKFQDKQVSPALVAASFLALPYAHYAYSRADIAHLAQGIFPLLVGCLILLSTQPTKIKWPLALMLCAASLWVMHLRLPGWNCNINKQCVNVEVSGTNLQVGRKTASRIELLRHLTDQYAPAVDQSFIVTPFWPGAYALLERKSPMWAIYALWARGDAFQEKEIERIKIANPEFIFVYDFPLDGQKVLRFQNTHHLIHRYILDHFERIPYEQNSSYQIHLSKGH